MRLSLASSCADAYIVESSYRELGNIVESINDKDCESIFDVYDMALSEVNFVKRISRYEERGIFGIKTLSSEAIIFIKRERDSYAMSAFSISISQVKELVDNGICVHMSPTLERYVRKCRTMEKSEFFHMFYSMISEYSSLSDDKEYLYRGIAASSSVYNCNISIRDESRVLYSGAEAIMSREFLSVMLQCVCIASVKYGKGEADIFCFDRGDIFSLDIFLPECSGERVDALLKFLSDMADSLCTYFTYFTDGNGVRIKTCPYFADEGLLGVKSRIIFEI